jgi:tRNA(Ile)-lysidine synthase
MNPESLFLEFLRRAWPPEAWTDEGVLIAVSGGADSVALLRGLAAIADGRVSQLCVAHLNHRLRGAEGDEDADFVQELATELALPAVIGDADVQAEQRGGEGVEAAARRVRYRFLRAEAERRGFRYVAVGHTADDQAETVLHRLLRGTGVRGIAGMPRVRTLSPAVSLIRPLLGCRREELREYLRAIDQTWREDRTNDDPRYTRNRLRKRLIPFLEEEFGPQVVSSICRTAQLAGESQSLLAGETVLFLDRAIMRRDRDVVTLSRRVLAAASPVFVREALREIWRLQHWPERSMGFAEWEQLATLPTSQTEIPARVFPGNVRAVWSEEVLLLTRANIL